MVRIGLFSFRKSKQHFAGFVSSTRRERPRLGRFICQNHKVVRRRAAPARLVDGGLGLLCFQGVVVMFFFKFDYWVVLFDSRVMKGNL